MTKRSLLIHPDELSEQWIHDAASLKLDTLALHPVGGYRATESLKELIALQSDDNYRKLIDLAVSKGLKIEYEFHAAGNLIPRDLFDAHPDWFRMDENGDRQSDYNFCVSNDDALDEAACNALKIAKKLYKSTDSYYFWLDDKEDKFCMCPKCRMLSPSDQNLKVMNAIIGKLKTFNPDAKLAYLAYQQTKTVPDTIKPEDGIFLEYAPIERDINLTAEEDPKTDNANLEKLIGFFGKKDSKVLEYWFDNSKYSEWKKPPKKFTANDRIIKEDMDYYSSLGFEYLSSFACYLGSDYRELFGNPNINIFIDYK